MKILIVDDHPGMARTLGRSLQRMGHEPVLLDDALDALRHVDDSIDAVILEVALPSLGGVELARVMHRRHPGLQVAFYTALADDDPRFIAATRLGYVLHKPWNRGELVEMLDTLTTPAADAALAEAMVCAA